MRDMSSQESDSAKGGQTLVSAEICKTCGHSRTEHPEDDVCWSTVIVDGKGSLCRCRKFESTDSKPKARHAASGKT
jgi:hypothetical protein